MLGPSRADPNTNRASGEFHKQILIVTAGRDVQEQLFETGQMPIWSSRFDLVLEKQGYLSFDTCEYWNLKDRIGIPYDVVICTHLPGPAWKTEYLAQIQSFNALKIFEGPFPNWVSRGLDLPVATTGLSNVSWKPVDKQLCDTLNQRCSAFWNGEAFSLKNKSVVTRSPLFTRWDNDVLWNTVDFSFIANRIVRSVYVPIINRLRTTGALAKHLDPALTLFFLREAISRSDGELKQDLHIVQRAIEDSGLLERDTPHSIFGPLLDPMVGSFSSGEWADRRPKGQGQRPTGDGSHQILAIIAESKKQAIESRCLIQEAEKLIDFSSGSFATKERASLEDVAAAAWAFSLAGEPGLSKSILGNILEKCFDFEEGYFRKASFEGETITEANGWNLSPVIGLAFLEHLGEFIPRERPGERLCSGYPPAVLESWRSDDFSFALFEQEGNPCIAQAYTDDGRFGSAVSAKGDIVVFPFQALSYIVHFHTMHPLNGPFTDCDANGAICLETCFWYLLDRYANLNDIQLLRVGPWPAGYHYCLTIRHDVDRIPDADTFDSLLSFEIDRGLGVSWFWIFNRLEKMQIQALQKTNHEIALHAMRHDRKTEELAVLEEALDHSRRIVGECIHGGGGGGDYWLGHPSVRGSVEQGLAYGEGVSTLYDFPHRFPALDSDGVVVHEDQICISHTVSVDRPADDPNEPAWHAERLKNCVRAGYYVMVLNHPDKNFERVVSIVGEGLPKEGRLDWTCAKVADWWRRTHVREMLDLSLRYKPDGDFDISVCAEQDVAGLVLFVGAGTSKPLPGLDESPSISNGVEWSIGVPQLDKATPWVASRDSKQT